MELTDALKTVCSDTAESLTGSARRLFMARVVQHLGPGGQRRAERELGWCRVTIRKGRHELESGFTCVDAVSARGRKRAEEHLPHLLEDIRAIVDSQSQADPQVRTTRLATRLSAAEVRRQLIAQQGYTNAELPTEETIRTKLNALGSSLKTVAKTHPQKSSRNGCHLRAGSGRQCGRRCGTGGVAGVDGCQSHRQGWPLQPGRPQPG